MLPGSLTLAAMASYGVVHQQLNILHDDVIDKGEFYCKYYIIMIYDSECFLNFFII